MFVKLNQPYCSVKSLTLVLRGCDLNKLITALAQPPPGEKMPAQRGQRLGQDHVGISDKSRTKIQSTFVFFLLLQPGLVTNVENGAWVFSKLAGRVYISLSRRMGK